MPCLCSCACGTCYSRLMNSHPAAPDLCLLCESSGCEKDGECKRSDDAQLIGVDTTSTTSDQHWIDTGHFMRRDGSCLCDKR